MVVFTIFWNINYVQAEDSGLNFTEIKVINADNGEIVADLMKNEVPKLKVGTTYALNIAYDVPKAMQFEDNFLSVNLGKGLYFKTLPGATFEEGPIEDTGFSALVKTPKGADSIYGYPKADSEQNRYGELIYKSSKGLTAVASRKEICFAVDSSYVNEDVNQLFKDGIKVSLGKTNDTGEDNKTFDVNAADDIHFGFYVNQATEVVSKGGTTEKINSYTTGGGSFLTEENSKTFAKVIFPQDLELKGLEEVSLYKKYGKVESEEIEGNNKVVTVSWEEKGSYSAGLSFIPHITVPADSDRANGSRFDVIVKDVSKTVWNDTPDANRTSKKSSAKMTVQIIDGTNPEVLKFHSLVDYAPNWAYKKYDTYNTRLGALLIKNELAIPSQKEKTIDIKIDTTDTAIIRGITIPYKKDKDGKDLFQYGKIYWTAGDGTSGVAEPDIIEKSNNVSGLIKNTNLGLDINTSIKSIKIDIGKLPAEFDGIKTVQDSLDTWNPSNTYLSDEYYGWSYIPLGVYGSWKKGTYEDVVSTVDFYNTGETPTEKEHHIIKAKSSAPEVLNGVGNIDKKQILGGDSFKISGTLDDGNWDWNPLQEPVIYVMMPEGFSYSNLKLTEGELGKPEYIGEFEDKNEVPVKVWKYSVDIGKDTRGQYQPDFSIKSMKMSMDVKTDKTAEPKTYHIRDFFGFTTKDFKEIGAVNKAEHWDRSNWITTQYTLIDNKKPENSFDIFNGKVNSGNPLVSLSEGPGVMVKQALAVSAYSTLVTVSGNNEEPKSYVYDDKTDESKAATTVVLKKGQEATIKVSVRNNSQSEIEHVSLYLPMVRKGADYGKGFNPEGEFKLPLTFVNTTQTSNFIKAEYLKLKEGVSYDLNTAPKEEDYEIVEDPKDADIIHFKAKKAFEAGDGGTVKMKFVAGEDLNWRFNNAKDVLTPVLDYDLHGNKSTLTLEPAALSFEEEVPELRTIKVKKKWIDDNNSNVLRPQEIKVNLIADGDKENPVKTEKITPDAQGNWELEFKEVLVYNGEEKIKYTVEEEEVDNYSAEVTGNMEDGFTITNTISGKLDIEVNKKWIGKKAPSINVKLFRDDKEITNIDIDEKDGWHFVFKELPKYDTKDGHKYAYKVVEMPIAGYQSRVEMPAPDTYLFINEKLEDGDKPKPNTPTDIQNHLRVSDNPETGDNTRFWLWGIIVAAAIASLLVIVILRFKNKKNS